MSDHPAAETKGGFVKWALWGVALIGVAGVLYIIAQASTNPDKAETSAPKPVATAAKGLNVDRSNAGKPATDYVFQDTDGKSLTIADLKGEVVVMNLWATWCAPCKIEMPTLAALQAGYEGKPVKVLAISIDKADAVPAAKAFIAQHAPLGFYSDPAAKLPWAMTPQAVGLPTTVIYGKDGLERARISGEADWNGAQAKALIDKVLAEG